MKNIDKKIVLKILKDYVKSNLITSKNEEHYCNRCKTVTSSFLIGEDKKNNKYTINSFEHNPICLIPEAIKIINNLGKQNE